MSDIARSMFVTFAYKFISAVEGLEDIIKTTENTLKNKYEEACL
jgi:hypothetical protein